MSRHRRPRYSVLHPRLFSSLPVSQSRKRSLSSHTSETPRGSRPEFGIFLTSSEITFLTYIDTSTASNNPRRTNGKRTSFPREDQNSTRVDPFTLPSPFHKGGQRIHRQDTKSPDVLKTTTRGLERKSIKLVLHQRISNKNQKTPFTLLVIFENQPVERLQWLYLDKNKILQFYDIDTC